ncbi:MAG: LAS superfamily LD-carboxypeptidase LdcB [Planctomycetota bacterium]|jgi:LAS superfamily LD-carboxypeptidase LdcB
MTLESVLHQYGLEAEDQNLTLIPGAPEHEVRVLRVVAAPFAHMVAAAASVGVELVPVSGFRSVERQTRIWSRKVKASIQQFGDRQSAVCQVMEYSAPPGWSRHHWGTDIDLVGGSLREKPRLEAEDWHRGGSCSEAAEWLSNHAAAFGFVRPYDEHRRGFMAEPWHWSFLPTASSYLPLMRRIDWKCAFDGEDFEAADLLANQVGRLFPDFVLGINPILL